MLVATSAEEKFDKLCKVALEPPANGAEELPRTIVRKRNFVERSDIYRPRFHFTAPKAWINDPCAPIYYKGQYHMFYQYVPNTCVWGQPLMWGHAVSQDLLSWMDVYDDEQIDAEGKLKLPAQPKLQINGNFGVMDRTIYPIALQGSDWYDHCAVFSGSMLVKGLHGKPTLFYTGITQLPIHWTLPYVTGSEVQIMATARDDTLHHWAKASEPLILNPPPKHNLVGFRDPFVFKSPHLDELLRGHFCANTQEESCLNGAREPADGFYYLILGGGFKDKGGAVFMYRSSDLVRWEYDERFFLLYSNPSDNEVTGFTFTEFGNNWERPELFRLVDSVTDELSPYYMLSFGVEGTTDPHGGLELSVIFKFKTKFDVPGTQERLIDVIDVERFDFGNFYASTAMDNTESETNCKLYKFGWVREQILPMKLENGEFKTVKRPHQPFAGVLSLPRDVSMFQIHDVLRSDGTIGSVDRVWMDVSCINHLRERARHVISSNEVRHLECDSAGSNCLPFETLAMSQASILADGTMDLEFDVSFNNSGTPGSDAAFSLYIRLCRESSTGAMLEEQTEVSFDLSSGVVCVDRSKSTLVEEDMHNEYGDFQLYQIKPADFIGSDYSKLPYEDMKWRVVWDRSILEIFINNRFCLTTRIYPTLLLGLDNTFMAAQQAIRNGASLESPAVDHLAQSPISDTAEECSATLVDAFSTLSTAEEAFYEDKALVETTQPQLKSIESVLNRRKSIKTKPNKELAFVDIGIKSKKGKLVVKRVDLWTAFSTMYEAISI